MFVSPLLLLEMGGMYWCWCWMGWIMCCMGWPESPGPAVARDLLERRDLPPAAESSKHAEVTRRATVRSYSWF